MKLRHEIEGLLTSITSNNLTYILVPLLDHIPDVTQGVVLRREI